MRSFDRLDDASDMPAVDRTKIRARSGKNGDMAGDCAPDDARERKRDDPSTYRTSKRDRAERTEQPNRAIAGDDEDTKRVRCDAIASRCARAWTSSDCTIRLASRHRLRCQCQGRIKRQRKHMFDRERLRPDHLSVRF